MNQFLLFRLSWWCNRLASCLLIGVYIIMYSYFSGTTTDMVVHDMMIASVMFHMCMPWMEKEILEFLKRAAIEETGLTQWWLIYGRLVFRDGLMIVSAIIAVILLQFNLVWEKQLKDSTLYVPVDDSSVSRSSHTSTRRRRRWRQRHFRCVLIRFVVFGMIYSRRRRWNCHRRRLEHVWWPWIVFIF